jgi:hypothetical protein
MENLSDYINVFTTMPVATLLLVHMYFSHKRENNHNEETLKILSKAFEKQSELLGDALKVIKQQERKE